MKPHNFRLNQRQQWACEQPEAPFNDSMVFDVYCDGCRMKAGFTVTIEGDQTSVNERKSLAVWLEYAEAKFLERESNNDK